MNETGCDPRTTAPMGRIVRMAIVTVTLVLFFASSFHALLGHRDIAVMLALATPLGLSAWGFAHAGHGQPAMLLLCGVLVVVATLILVRNPLGFHDVVSAAYVGVAVVAALLLRRPFFIAIMVLILVGATASFVADALGKSPSEVVAHSGWPQYAVLLVMIAVFAGLGRIVGAHAFGGLGAAQLASMRDPMTGLANRAAFIEAAGPLLNACRERGQCGVLVLCDLDEFRRVNLVIGREAADRLLAEAARRLLDVAAGHLVARVGDDEFGVLALGLPEDRMAAVAGEVHAALDFGFQGAEVRNAAGAARFPRDGDDIDTLMLCATSGLAQAKAGEAGRLAMPADRI